MGWLVLNHDGTDLVVHKLVVRGHHDRSCPLDPRVTRQEDSISAARDTR